MQTTKNKRSERLSTAVVIATAALLIIGLADGAFADNRHGGKGGWAPAKMQLRMDGTQLPGGCPIESPTGRFLFTARNPSGMNIDIYANERAAIGEPFAPGGALPAPVNDVMGANDFCPTPLPDNQLYFVSNREGSCGATDMYYSIQHPAFDWQEPVQLGCDPHGPNTPGTEFSPSIIKTVWGTFLFFSTDYYTGNQDIYWSYRRPDGTFSRGIRLPYPINTEYDDRQPNVSQDGREIAFTSNRPTSADDESGFDIFYAKRRFLFSRWRRVTNLSETVPFETVGASETRPSFSWDGERIVYGSGGVWVSERK